MNNKSELGGIRRDFLKLAGSGLAMTWLLQACDGGMVAEAWVGSQPDIETESGLWTQVTNPELCERFEKIDESAPVWGDGGMKVMNGELAVIFSAPQTVNVSSGFADEQVILRVNYPDSRIIALSEDQDSAKRSVASNISPRVLSDLLTQVDGFKYDVDLLVDTVIQVSPEVMASTGVLGIRRLEATFENSQVKGMPLILIDTPHEVFSQDGGTDGYYVRITHRQLGKSGYYRFTASD